MSTKKWNENIERRTCSIGYVYLPIVFGKLNIFYFSRRRGKIPCGVSVRKKKDKREKCSKQKTLRNKKGDPRRSRPERKGHFSVCQSFVYANGVKNAPLFFCLLKRLLFFFPDWVGCFLSSLSNAVKTPTRFLSPPFFLLEKTNGN